MKWGETTDKTRVMGIRREHILGILPTLVLGAMVCTVLAVAGTSRPATERPGMITHGAATKAELLASLTSVDGAACDPGGVFLFVGNAPLMVVWMASEPAELYNGDGDFAGSLSRLELATLIDTTRLFTQDCLASSPIAEPLPSAPKNYPL